MAAVQHELLLRRALDVLVTPTGCLGPCFDGPNAVVYPDGVWYAGLDVTDATALVDHLIDGTRFDHKAAHRPGSAEPESRPATQPDPTAPG